ncbi:hypothetical protein ACMHYO_16070 [Allopusillimonas ginsengisoli]|uniref:hypothetical protein n=1 Tax=Allopusillimonas ginsengisoli TaxID=453575 RepID=UPI0039C2A2A5
MPKLRPGTLFPSKEEDNAINRGIASDPDTYELGGDEMKYLKRVCSKTAALDSSGQESAKKAH